MRKAIGFPSLSKLHLYIDPPAFACCVSGRVEQADKSVTEKMMQIRCNRDVGFIIFPHLDLLLDE